jgi:hypothetical protein
MQRVVACLSVVAFVAGCGPTLSQVQRTSQAFAVQQRCSQGPFEVHVPAFGSKWGEDITVEARGNAVDGHETMTIDGKPYSDGPFGTISHSSDNSACMLSDADRAAASASSTSTGAGTGTSTGSGTSTGTTTTTTAPGGNVPLVAAGSPANWLYSTQIAQYHHEVDDWSTKDGVLKRGQDIKIVFWSGHPLDLNGTTFIVTHSEMVPPGGDDKKWSAHLDEVKADAERKQREAEADAKKQQAEAEAKAREEARCGAVQGADAKCHDEGYKTATEAAAYAAFQDKCEDMARRNATDQACRDDGWRNANERPDYHPTTVAEIPSPTPTIVTQPQRPADRPPPPPQAEAQPPRPSEHAEWVPGSWQWNGSDWVWLSGGWRVPETDRAQKLTATAPSAPPPSRVEVRPAQPLASAVWAEGYWHWSGRWIWVPGHWAVPPSAGATWRPSTWVPDGLKLRLNPGGWVVR